MEKWLRAFREKRLGETMNIKISFPFFIRKSHNCLFTTKHSQRIQNASFKKAIAKYSTLCHRENIQVTTSRAKCNRVEKLLWTREFTHLVDNITKEQNLKKNKIELKQEIENPKTETKNDKMLYLVNPRGFCKGVSRAIETVEVCLKLFKTDVYVKHKIVHNDVVCAELEKKGAIFVDDVNEVPDGKVLIYSAHGVGPQIRELAKKKNLIEIDATCPLVNKVHVYVKQMAKEGYKIILIGHKNHVEIIGTFSEAPDCTYIVENEKDVDSLQFNESDKLFYTTQTTLSLDDCAMIINKLKQKFPKATTIPSGSICYATTNRQQALNKIVTECDLTIVVGSQSSSNAKKLVYSSQFRNVPAVLLNTVDDLKTHILTNVKNIAITSAASTPETETAKFVQLLTNPPYNFKLQIFDGVQEKVPKWKLPKNLLERIKAQ